MLFVLLRILLRIAKDLLSVNCAAVLESHKAHLPEAIYEQRRRVFEHAVLPKALSLTALSLVLAIAFAPNFQLYFITFVLLQITFLDMVWALVSISVLGKRYQFTEQLSESFKQNIDNFYNRPPRA